MIDVIDIWHMSGWVIYQMKSIQSSSWTCNIVVVQKADSGTHVCFVKTFATAQSVVPFRSCNIWDSDAGLYIQCPDLLSHLVMWLVSLSKCVSHPDIVWLYTWRWHIAVMYVAVCFSCVPLHAENKCLLLKQMYEYDLLLLFIKRCGARGGPPDGVCIGPSSVGRLTLVVVHDTQ